MLAYMKPSNTLWATVALCAVGLWAGAAGAQAADEQGSWFADSPPPASAPAASPDGVTPEDPAAPAESPSELWVPDYSVPPADFQTPPDEAAAPESPAAEAPADRTAEAEGQQRAVQEFGPELAPYGSWVDDPWYGRIWVPSHSVVGAGFVPYSSAGHWQLTTDDAWLWASDYPFGRITFHYGRWVYASGGVWGWVPGYVYAPAWVDFRIGAAGYIGWVPLAPRYVWRSGYFVSVGLWRAPPPIYCPTQYVFARSMPRYVVRDHARVRALSAQTHPYRSGLYRSGRYAYRGPSPAEARIPARALPPRRVVAQPRYAGSQFSRESHAAQRPHINVTGNGARRGGGSQRDYGWNGSGHSYSSNNYSNTYGTPRVRSYDGPSGAGRREMSPNMQRPRGSSDMHRPNPAAGSRDGRGQPQDGRRQQWRSGNTPGMPGQSAAPHAGRPGQPQSQPAAGGQRYVRRGAMPEQNGQPERSAAGRVRQPRAGASHGAQSDARSYSRPDYSRSDARPDYARSNRSDYSRSNGGQQRATRRSGGSGDSQSYRGRSHSRSYR